MFAPDVDLTDFRGEYTGTFIPDADGDYIIRLESGKDDLVLSVDGKEVAKRYSGGRNGHNLSHMFTAKAGQPVDIKLSYSHGADVADLKFDVVSAKEEPVDFSDADIVIFAGGISPKLEGEEMKVSVPGFRGGDRETIELPRVQRELIKKIKDAGKQVIYVNFSGSAVALAPDRIFLG